MGLASNISMSIPTSIILYLLINKLIFQFISQCRYDNIQQKGFILEFICGLALLVIAISTMANPVIKYSLFFTSGFMIINSGILNWNCLDELSKILFLFILFALCVSYSYKHMK